MLFLALTPGDYLTIGDNVVIQLDKLAGNRCKLAVHAPKEVPVLRGKVAERASGERPDCLMDGPRWHRKEIVWSQSKEQALAAMRRQLSEMDGRDDGVKALRRQLNHMFPPEQAEGGPEGRTGPKPSEAGLVRRGEAAQ